MLHIAKMKRDVGIERKIVLIDGIRLAQLMIDHGIGVETAHTYVIKKVDLDYFADEES